MAQYIFGAGSIWATPLVDAFGNAIADGTPVQLLTSQEISMDESFETKKLYGQNQFPVDVGRGKGNLGVKAKFAQVNALAVSSVYFGQTLTAGLITYKADVVGAAIPTTPFQITPVVPSTGTWAGDMGVRNANGLPMTKVGSAATPTTGQYKVVAGLYTFAAADVGLTVFISFQYTVSSVNAPGSGKMTIQNLPMGAAPIVRLDVYFTKNGKSFATQYPNAIASKLGWQSKLDDYMVPEIEFEAFADAAGTVMYRSFSE
jgi:hypothetical protein